MPVLRWARAFASRPARPWRTTAPIWAAFLPCLPSEHPWVTELGERGVEAEGDRRIARFLTSFGDDEVCVAGDLLQASLVIIDCPLMVGRHLVRLRARRPLAAQVVFLAIEEHHEVGVLLNGTAL